MDLVKFQTSNPCIDEHKTNPPPFQWGIQIQSCHGGLKLRGEFSAGSCHNSEVSS
jgi:hypothetical protein